MVFVRNCNIFNVFSRLSTSFLIKLVLESIIYLVQITILYRAYIVILLHLE